MRPPNVIPLLRRLIDPSVLTGVLAVASLVMPRAGYSLFVREGTWAPNGPVHAIASSGNTLYIGGSFSLVGPVSGPAVAIDYTTAVAQKPYPRVTGRVRAVEPDGSGGWYIGGRFTAVQGQPRNNLAHIDEAGNLTPWNPDVNQEVLDIAVGSGVVYVGGKFTTVGQVSRQFAAAIGTADGIATSWVCTPSGMVTEVELGGTAVYIGGDFTVVSNEPRERRAALDVTTGALTGLFAGTGSGVAVTDALEFSAGKLFLATRENDGRCHFRVYDESAGAFLPYDVQGLRTIQDIAFDPVLGWAYLGGDFTLLELPYQNLAAVNIGTGLLEEWGHEASALVRTVSILHTVSPQGDPIDGVVVGGLFETIGGQPRKNIAVLHATQQHTVLGWSPGCGGEVHAVETDGGTIYAGGDFSIINGVPRSGLAAIDATAGSALNWAPTTNSIVDALLVSGNTVYVGGPFSRVNGTIRNLAAGVDALTGELTDFNPNVSGGSTVLSFAISENTLYMGGGFGAVGGVERIGIAAVNATTGALLPWDPGSNGSVHSISYVPGGIFGGPFLVVGGNFTLIGGQPRNYLATLDPVTGATGSLDSPNGPVHSLFVEPLPPGYGGFNRVFLGGSFSSVAGQPRNNIASLAAFGAVTSWDPNASWAVNSIAKVGNTAYVGGIFSMIGGQSRNSIAAIDTNSGLAMDWDPNALVLSSGPGAVHALLKQASTVYAGGSFTMIAGAPQSYFAGISDETITAVESEAAPGVTHSAVRFAPNPFDVSTRIQFSLASEGATRVTVFDVSGRRVREVHGGWLSSGRHVMPWDGRDDFGRPVAAGVYLVGVKTQTGTLSSKLYRLK